MIRAAHTRATNRNETRTPASAARNTTGARLEIGRLSVLKPVDGELSVYRKKDGRVGAAFDVANSIDRYGVAQQIRERFPDLGAYSGWAFIDFQRQVAFRFVWRDTHSQPNPLVSIATGDGRVKVPEHLLGRALPEDGTLVAFAARLLPAGANGRATRLAKEVMPLDASHVLEIAGLVAEGKVLFSQYPETVLLFLNAIPRLPLTEAEATDVVGAALAKLGSDPAVPPDYQMLARVERTRLGSAQAGLESAEPHPGSMACDGTARRTGASAAKTLAADVTQTKLLLD